MTINDFRSVDFSIKIFSEKIDLSLVNHTSLRIAGIDAPEIRGRKKSKKGIEAANYVKELLPKGKSFVYVYSGRKDSFGRELGDVVLPGERPLSLHLVSMGYGREIKN